MEHIRTKEETLTHFTEGWVFKNGSLQNNTETKYVQHRSLMLASLEKDGYISKEYTDYIWTGKLPENDPTKIKPETVTVSGSKVKVPKGTPYHSMKDGKIHYTKRNKVATTVGNSEFEATLHWAGSGGYWITVLKEDCSLA
jgi:hypothetical protein